MITVEHLRDLNLDPATHPRGEPHLSAASGLVVQGGRIVVAADDEHHLGVFDIDGTAPGHLIRFHDGDLPTKKKERKKQKPDTESLCVLPAAPDWPAGALFAMGSGSRPQRQTGVLMPLDAAGMPQLPFRHVDLAPLFDTLRPHFPELNIEGAFPCGDEFLLLQRGNKGVQSFNASIAFALRDFLRWLMSATAVPVVGRLIQHDLGVVGEVPLCFTDGAALPDGRWVFSAVAENTDDSYLDGPCAGAAIGVTDAKGSLLFMRHLPSAWKVEGIAAQVSGSGQDEELVLLMATDADDPAVASHLLRARITSGRAA